ncbi:MAG: hypothetical protein RL033_3449 [Pseudomonadota bacterium]
MHMKNTFATPPETLTDAELAEARGGVDLDGAANRAFLRAFAKLVRQTAAAEAQRPPRVPVYSASDPRSFIFEDA